MTIEILVIGTGQLGSRHLQAIAKIPQANVTVIDTDPSSLELAQTRYNEIQDHLNTGITYRESIEDCPQHLDLCIVATSSKPRRLIIEKVLKTSKVKYLILEKVLFQRPEDYKEIELLLSEHQVIAYVNCPRRTFDFYKEIKNLISPPLAMEVSGINWGLACNSIHFIDLFCYFTGNVSNLNFSTENLEKHFYESKRNSFMELNGGLFINQNESSLSLICKQDNDRPISFKILIQTKEIEIEIVEINPPSLKIENRKTGQILSYPIVIPYQSQMTDKIILELIGNGRCSLTSYSESLNMHLPYIHALIDFESKIKNTKITHCNIT